MGYLSFLVETYEQRLSMINSARSDDDEDSNGHRVLNERYLSDHPRANTHYRVRRRPNHNSLPNIVGPWFPRRDVEESEKGFYWASMLALLKPWRDLRCLKDDGETWRVAFERYMENTCQRDRDVVAGAQYYYESKNTVKNRVTDDEDERHDDIDYDTREDDGDEMDDEPDYISSVSE
jgi:hypothetical protein